MIKMVVIESVASGKQLDLDLLDLLCARVALDKAGVDEALLDPFVERGPRTIEITQAQADEYADALKSSPWSPYGQWGIRLLQNELVAKFLRASGGCRIIHVR